MDVHDSVAHDESYLSRPANVKKTRFFRILGLVLMLAGIAVMAYPATTFLVTTKAQDELRSDWNKLAEQSTKNLQSGTSASDSSGASGTSKASVSDKGPLGKAAFRLVIPQLDLDRIVVEGTNKASLKLGPGHMSNTVFPGESGVCVVSGHRTTYGAPFFRLDRLKNGHQIIIETNKSRFVYSVYDTKIVKPSDTSFITKSGHSVLALTTCTPIYSARRRLVILATLLQ